MKIKLLLTTLFSILFYFLSLELSMAQQIAAGEDHSAYACYNGKITTWGSKDYGQLGSGGDYDRYVPTAAPYYALDSVIAVSAIRGTTLLLRGNGDVYGSGIDNYFNNATFYKFRTPGKMMAVAGRDLSLKSDGTVWVCSTSNPKQLPGLENIVAISSNGSTSMALSSDGTVWAWGTNTYGQLGDTSVVSTEIPFHIKGLTNVKAIAVGTNFSLALKTDGTVFGWGSNQSIDTTSQYLKFLPTQVPGLKDVAAISAGGSCLALKSDSTVWSWANGTIALTQVSGLSGIIQIAAGGQHSLALQKNGIIWSWGYNNRGQLGIGTTVSSSKPVQTSCISAARILTTGISCNGKKDGKLTMEISNCLTPYTYQWNTGQTEPTITELGPGNYSVLVKDGLGCSKTFTTTITEPAAITATFTTQIICEPGTSTGRARVYTNQSNPTYLWSNGKTTEEIVNVPKGTYSVTVTSRTCSSTFTVAVVENPAMSATITVTGGKCYNSPDITATVNATGGTPAYKYTWVTSPNQYTQSITKIGNGVYTVFVRDQNQCEKKASVTINNGYSFIYDIQKKDASCYGGADGTATVRLVDKSRTFSYKWLPSGQTTALAVGLSAGTHSITVTDSIGCVESYSTTITQPSTPIKITIKKSNYCGTVKGTATAIVSGGAGSYNTYKWSNGQYSTTATNLDAGTYTFTVTDIYNCSASATVTIEKVGPLTNTISQQDIACYGGATGTATVLPNGKTPYTYSWNTSPVQTTATASGLTAKAYTVTVNDSNFCVTTSTVTIKQNTVLLLSTPIISNVCNYTTADSVKINGAGGVYPYTYLWSNGIASDVLKNSTSGTYTVTVTDKENCKKDFEVKVPGAMKLSISKKTNCDGLKENVAVTVTGGTPKYTYYWQYAALDATSTTLAVGTHTVSVVDSKNCKITDTIIVGPQPSVVTASITKTNVSCAGGNNGTATVVASGGIPGYTYNWIGSPSQKTATATGLFAGSYTVFTYDTNGCGAGANITIQEPTPLSLSVTSTNTCNGPNTGTATVKATGGTAPYSYLWMPGGQTTATVTGLVAGTYTVTVTDSLGCLQTATATILKEMTLTASSLNLINNISHKGAATVVVAGGVPIYTYAWSTSPVQITARATNLAAGTYTVVVSDTRGCSASTTLTLKEIGSKSPLSAGSRHSVYVCNTGIPISWGDNANGELGDGSFTQRTVPSTMANIDEVSLVHANAENSVMLKNDGTAWSTGSNRYGQLGDGTFTFRCIPVKVKGLSGLVDIGAFTPATLVLKDDGTIYSISNSAPYLITNQVDFVSLSGGLALKNDGTVWGYNSSQRTFSQVAGLSNIIAISGSYALKNDSTVWAWGANNEGQLGIGTTSNTNTTTPVQVKNISGIIAVAGGYSQGLALDKNGNVWSWGGNTYGQLGDGTLTQNSLPKKINNLTGVTAIAAGSYHSLALKNDGKLWSWGYNNGGQLGDGTFTNRNVPVQIKCATPAIKTIAVSCNGGNDATATPVIASCFSPFTYKWSTVPEQSTATVSGLSAGTYSLTITDANNCSATNTFKVTQPDSLLVSITQQNNCNASGGMATAIAKGGNKGYTYLWSNGQTTATVTGLSTGTYSVTVTDAKNCTATATVVIKESPAITLTSSQKNNVCYGEAKGSAAVVASGGVPAYTYLWNTSPVTTTPSATSLKAGDYTVLVKDVNACAATLTVTITQPTALLTSVTHTDNVCFGATGGTADVNVSGGSPGYSYVWTPGNYTTKSITALASGKYTLTVTDSNSCIKQDTTNITSPAALASTCTKTDVVLGLVDGTATVHPAGGTPGYTYLWMPGGQTTETITGLTSGTYSVTVTDKNLCSQVITVVINNVDKLTASISKINNCDGTATLTANAAGGNPAYSYLWNNGKTTQAITVSTSATYSVTIKDASQLSADATSVVNLFTVLTASITPKNANCEGDNSGSATAVASGGILPYTYKWSTGATTASISNLSKGSYTVTVSDSNACVVTTTVTITETSLLAATFQTTLPKCYGDKGTSTIYPTGGVAPYSYAWSTNPPITTQTATNLPNTTFSVTVTDALACSKTFTVSVPSPLPLQNNQPVIKQPTACNEPNGSILINVSGGTQPYYYNWLGYGLTTPDIKNIAQGVYKLQVTDANNCQQVFSTTLTCPTTIDEELEEDAFIVYPNPATDVVTIESTYGGTYAVLNELGQTILSVDLNAANRYTMKVEGLRSGVYFIVGITTENKAVRKKLVILREK